MTKLGRQAGLSQKKLRIWIWGHIRVAPRVRVVGDILDSLQIPRPETLEMQLDLVKRFWRKTTGDWHAMVLRARDLKISVAKKGGSDRRLTEEILDDVFGKDKKVDASSNG